VTPEICRVILHHMSGGGNPFPVQLLVNYWELCPTVGGSAGLSRKNSALTERLDQLVRSGVRNIASFVPWQAIESDISHMLTRFLQATAERDISVSLIITPEVGIHFLNSGIPKDVMLRNDDMAQPFPGKMLESSRKHDGNSAGTPARISVNLPPNAFSLPSLFAPEFNKRYYSFLSRMDALLADLGRNQPNTVARLTVSLSGSFWKYYRSQQLSSRNAFGGIAGDYCGSAAIAFRQRLEQFYSQREFLDPNPLAANRWKSRHLDEVNRRWFYQHSEDVFRNRTFQLVRKKANFLKTREIELYTPEADPGFCYSHFLHTLSGGNADISRLSAIIDQAASRATYGATSVAAPFMHWSSLGGFRNLSDPEKQFLILKSLLLIGGQGGGIILDESDWFSLSHAFRSRTDAIGKLIAAGQLKLRTKAIYLTPHVWSSGGAIWEEVFKHAGSSARISASVELAIRDGGAGLVIVDPATILTRELVFKLTALARAGRIVALPRTTLYTEAARRELEAVIGSTKRIDVDLGIPYHLHPFGEGKLVLFEVPDKTSAPWGAFVGSMLALAEVEGHCRMSDSRLNVIPLEKPDAQLGVFILNETRRHVAADIIFPNAVAVSDFAGWFSADAAVGAAETDPVVANRFSLEAAPCGVLSLAVNTERTENNRRVQPEADIARGAPKHEQPAVTHGEAHGTDL